MEFEFYLNLHKQGDKFGMNPVKKKLGGAKVQHFCAIKKKDS